MLKMKETKVLIGRYVDKKDGPTICDSVASYKTDDADVKVGDLYYGWHRGHLMFFQVDKIVPRFMYSQARYGVGDFDAMSWAIGKADVEGHENRKAARNKIRDIQAALDEIIAKQKAKKELDEAIKGLDKDAQADIKEALACIAALEADPNAVVNL